jgi:hypothetical protein
LRRVIKIIHRFFVYLLDEFLAPELDFITKKESVMSDDPTIDSKPTGRASFAIWAGIKYGVLAYALWYVAKWLGWV